MGAFSSVTELSNQFSTKHRKAVVSAVGPASYDTNGSVIDLSALAGGGFTKVHGVRLIGVGAHAADKYHATFIPGASYSPSTGTLKLRDMTNVIGGTVSGGTITVAAPVSEVASTTDLSGVTFVFEVIGL